MKKLLLFIVLTSSLVYSQSSEKKSLIELQSQIKTISTEHNLILQATPADIPGKKNPGLAIFYSLLLPGMGELYAGNYESGKYFTIADGALWGVYAGFNIYGNWQRDNYKSFAQSRGGADIKGKDADYFANMSLYVNIDEYNKDRELNRYFDQVYDTDRYYWNWQDNATRREYRNMWTSSEEAFNNVRFAVGALVLNRIISAINAVRIVVAHNKNLSTQTAWNVSFGVDNNPTLPSTFKMNFVTSF